MRSSPLVRTASTVLAALALPSAVYPFSFTFSNPVACEDLGIQWTGGTPPFQFLITPTYGTPRNYSIPNNNFDGTKGSFKTQLQMRPVGSQKVDQFLLTMSDAKGFGTGGTSGLLTAAPSSTGVTCNLTDPGVAFAFNLPNSLQQCRDFTFTQYTGATQPVTIYGLIPSGNSFQLNPPRGPFNFNWIANIAARTSLVVFMVDSRGRQGGASDLLIVGNSDEAGCLNANSPSSTASSPTPISTSSSNTPSNATPAPTADNGNSPGPTGVVIGGVIVGSIVALVAFSTLGMFLYSRRRSKKDPPSAHFLSGKRNGRRVHSVDLTAAQSDGPHSSPMYPPQEYYVTPFVSPPHSGYGPERQDEYNIVPYSPFSGVSDGRNFNAAPSLYSGDESAIHQTQRSTSRRSAQYSRSRGTSISSKAAMAGLSASGYGPTPRFVLHTDAGVMDEVGEEVVELPPTYNDVSRGTAPNTPTAATQNQSPTNHSHSYSGGASVVDAQLHPLAPSPVLSDRDELDSYDLGNGLALGSRSRSPPQSPYGTRHTQQQHGYPFSSPSAQSGSS